MSAIVMRTESVCPTCLSRVDARYVSEGDDTFLEKRCPDHGEFRVIAWRGPPAFEAWGSPHAPSPPREPQTAIANGCPFDCGLCADHRQRTCCVLVEVTRRCNLRCPFCFASAGEDAPDPTLDVLTQTLQGLLDAGGPYNLQLSGGEPTLRDDLPDVVARTKAMGFDFVQLNTNGIRLARDEAYARRLCDAGLSCVYLQFDGVRDDVYRRTRGASLFATKVAAVGRCEELGLGVVLVPTVVPGVNDAELGDILRFALARGPAVRGVHFQPVSYFGRFPSPPADADRLTLPEVMNALERQTGGMVRVADFRPGAAENARCSFSATFTRMPDGALRPMRSGSAGCCAPRRRHADAGEGGGGGEARAAQDAVARRWTHPDACCEEPSSDSSTLSLDAFLSAARRATFSISGMAFQDAYTLDLARLRDCHIHVANARRSIIPFCAFNLTSALGASLYRRG